VFWYLGGYPAFGYRQWLVLGHAEGCLQIWCLVLGRGVEYFLHQWLVPGWEITGSQTRAVVDIVVSFVVDRV